MNEYKGTIETFIQKLDRDGSRHELKDPAAELRGILHSLRKGILNSRSLTPEQAPRNALAMGFKSASNSGIAYLNKTEYPNSVKTFYEFCEPISCIECNDIRLCNIKELEIENTQATPGSTLFPFGYRVIATTLYGDVLVINSNEENGPVYIACHDEIEEGANEEEIKNKIIEIASSFEDFLDKFTNKEILSSYYDYENA